jgi:dihydropteroate synthase
MLAPSKMTIGKRVVDFGVETLVMGILNCTPDSFYPGSRKTTKGSALRTARDMVECGVDIVDVGGESTRPGSKSVTAEEEIDRVCPVIEAIRGELDTIISVDTTKSSVAEEALRVGADMVNDVSALKGDTNLAQLVARMKVPIVLMHMRGTPKTMQENPYYEDTIGEIEAELKESVRLALKAGVLAERIIVDPGIGFGKRLEDNLRIIRYLERLKTLGFPLLIGLSRKSFLGLILDLPVEQRLVGTITANTIAILNGANIVRAHDFREAVQMVRVIEAIQSVSPK